MGETGEGSPVKPDSIQDQPEAEPLNIKKSSGGLRDRFMKTARGVALGAVLLTPTVGAPPPVRGAEDTSSRPTPTETLPSAEQQDPVEEIREFIEAKGDEELSFDEAKTLVKPLAKFYSQLDTRFTAEEMEKRVFIIRGDAEPEDYKFPYIPYGVSADGSDNFDSPVFERLKQDYPDIVPEIDIKNNTVGVLGLELIGGKAIAFVKHDLVFVFLDRANGFRRNASNKYLQFNNFEDRSCVDAAPANFLIHSILHEFGHLDQPFSDQEYLQSEEIQKNSDLFTKNDKDFKGRRPTTVEKNAFRIDFDFDDGKNPSGFLMLGADENVVDFIATKLTIDNNIPTVTIGENAPTDAHNFNAILKQAGISAEELLKYHRNSDIEGFVSKVAGAAEGVSFSSEEAKLRFGLKLFAPYMQGKYAWEIPFKKYFPEVDISGYKVDKPRDTTKRTFPGCGVPNEVELENKNRKNNKHKKSHKN